MSRKFKSLLNLTSLPSDPSGSDGDIFFNTTEKVLKIKVDGLWSPLAFISDIPAFPSITSWDLDLVLDYNGNPVYSAGDPNITTSANKFADGGVPSTITYELTFDSSTI